MSSLDTPRLFVAAVLVILVVVMLISLSRRASHGMRSTQGHGLSNPSRDQESARRDSAVNDGDRPRRLTILAEIAGIIGAIAAIAALFR